MAKSYIITEVFEREWNRIRRKVDGLRGVGVRNDPDCITINPSATGGEGGAGTPGAAGAGTIALTITSNHADDHKYNATIVYPTESASEEVIALNKWEEAGVDAAHVLDTSGFPLEFPGIDTGSTSSGKRIIAIYAFQPGCA